MSVREGDVSDMCGGCLTLLYLSFCPSPHVPTPLCVYVLCAPPSVNNTPHHHHPPTPPSWQVAELGQEVRDHVGTCLLRLTLRELYDWRFMQTDPNWGNFLYDQQSGVLNLIDFGAAKQYPRG